MFNSAVLDLAVGLIFCFLSVSLTAGVIVEAIASLFAVRAKTLRAGIAQLLNDPNYKALAKEIYAHAAVNPRGDGTVTSASSPNKNDPAYIDRQLFSQAMLDILKISPEIATAPGGKPTTTTLKNAVDSALGAQPSAQLQTFFHGVIDRSLGDPDKIKGELVAWFDNSMDRVSGWYKRWTQVVSIVVGFVLAAGLNIDAINVAKVLWTQPKLVEELKLPAALPAGSATASPLAEATAPGTSRPGTGAATPAPSGIAASRASNEKTDAADMLHQINMTLPVGWAHGVLLDEKGQWVSWGAFWLALLGWAITALSTLFGAPFWFDLLQTVIRLKGAGPSPKEKVDDKGAAA
jgi:hypothetical protein